MNLKIECTFRGKIALLAIEGEVDMYSSPDVRKALINLVKKKVPKIVVDLHTVSYMDSSGVATLIEGLQLCNKYGGHIVLVGLRDNVKEVFELTRLDKIFKILADVETALAQ